MTITATRVEKEKKEMNTLLENLVMDANKVYTENGARAYASTMCKTLDLFAMGAAYRQRSDADCIL